MNQEHPLLSICIPTYNGEGSSLDLVLEAAVKITNHYEDIEIIVSDNCSTDNTQELVQSWIAKCSRLRYYRNEINIGFNGNMLNLANYSKGEYSWMMGDDDVINLNTFGTIYKTLKEGIIDYLSIRFKTAFKEDFAVGENIGGNGQVILGSYSDILQNNCFRGNTLATFMGSSIFRTSMFQSVDTSMIENKFDNYYNCFPNAYIVATAFHDAQCAYIQDPCIICISSKNFKKGYENLASWAIIDTKAIVELYKYVCSLGIKHKYLKQTENRIIYDNIITGTKLLVSGKGLQRNFYKSIIKAMVHPLVLIALCKRALYLVFKVKKVVEI